MGHRLTPTEEALERTLDEMIARLREAFTVVEVDRERGADHIGDMIAQLLVIREITNASSEPQEAPIELDEHIHRLNGLRSNAAFLLVADNKHDEDQSVTFNLVPGEEIIIGYANQNHEDIATNITQRVATVLGYVRRDL